MTDYEYWDTSKIEPSPRQLRKQQLARTYQYELDLAFFVVHFGFSKQSYDALTETEKLFIHKAFEEKVITENTYLRDAVFNALNNALRKKGTKFQELFKKKQEKADITYNQEAIEIVNALETQDKSWVERIYQANGLAIPREE